MIIGRWIVQHLNRALCLIGNRNQREREIEKDREIKMDPSKVLSGNHASQNRYQISSNFRRFSLIKIVSKVDYLQNI